MVTRLSSKKHVFNMYIMYLDKLTFDTCSVVCKSILMEHFCNLGNLTLCHVLCEQNVVMYNLYAQPTCVNWIIVNMYARFIPVDILQAKVGM